MSVLGRGSRKIAFLLQIILIFGAIFSVAGCGEYRQETPSAYFRVSALVRAVNNYCVKNLGYKETPNFQEYSPSLRYKYVVNSAPSANLPYDYSQLKEKEFKDEESARKYAKQFDGLSDVYIYKRRAHSGGFPVTDDFLALNAAEQVFSIIHEDWHDNSGFSLSLEESSGSIIGYVGAIEFLNKNNNLRKNLRIAEHNLRWSLLKAKVVVKYYGLLEDLYKQKNAGMDDGTMMYFKEEILKDAKNEFVALERRTGLKFSQLDVNNASLSAWIAYDRYLDVCWRVYLGTGKNPGKTAKIFQGMTRINKFSAVPEWLLSKEKIREYELLQVEYLEKYAVKEN